MRKLNIDENFVKKVNELRIDNLNGQYNLAAIKEMFKEKLNIYLSGTWIMYLVQYKILNPVKIGKKYLYSFTTFPVHKEKLKNMYNDILNYNRSHSKKVPQLTEVEVLNPIEEAIKLLKENGYKILKQTVEYKEI